MVAAYGGTRRSRRFVVLAMMAGLAGCAEFVELPLSDRSPLVGNPVRLEGGDIQRGHRLAVDDVVRLALANNPDLKAFRAQRAVARAQLLQASLPPNPSFSAAVLPLLAGVGTTTAYNLGVSYDLKSLITLSVRQHGAEATAFQVDAQTLWQEWQVAGQARLLVVDIVAGDRLSGILSGTQRLLEERLDASQKSLAAGNTTLVAVAPNIASVQTLRIQGADLARLQLQRRHQLNALLGLQPEARLVLAPHVVLPPFNPAAIRRDLPGLADRRPDLVALQFGYGAQDDKVRAAILGQFPNLAFGLAGGSDNANVRNLGPQATLAVPLFDRNQGNIAIETATRQQLYDEFGARLAAAEGQVRATLAQMALLRAQLERARQGLGPVRSAADQATAALAAGNLDERGYVELLSARLSKEQEVASLEQLLLEQQVTIATLTGTGLPRIIKDEP